jgi:hypothetical protein
MQKFGVGYKVNEWRLFINSTKRSLNAVLLHNGRNCASVPIGHSEHHKENDKNLQMVLKTIGYAAHDWMICGDLKVMYMRFGQRDGYTKYSCFKCEWDSTARSQHWKQKHWTQRISFEPRSKKVLRKSLVDTNKILLP